ncbi:hypothetical protein ACFFRR_005351 [Megaselia abdita]
MRKYSKLSTSTSASSIQNGHIIRFLMVIAAVILTLFIYAFYNSAPIATHTSLSSSSAALLYQSAPAHGSQSSVSMPSSNLNDDVNSRNLKNKVVNSHRFSIRNNQSTSSTKINNSINYVINTTQSQQLLQDADEILFQQNNANILEDDGNLEKNDLMDKDNNFNTNATTNYISQINQTSNIMKIGQNSFSALNRNSSQVEKIIKINNFNLVTTTTSTTKAIQEKNKKYDLLPIIKKTDPLKGIPTKHIYEKGHLGFNQQNLCPLSSFNGLDPVILPQIKLFIFVTSAPSHFDARLAIRQTWGNYANRRDISVAYLLGQSRNSTIEDKLDNENELYGDLIRGNFIDSYNNLTLKTISMLEWLDKNCNNPLPKFILKTDDDMFINVPKLLLFIDKHSTEKKTIYGRLAKKWKPIRNKNSKYYVAPSQFSSTVFPHFTTGPAYLLSSDIVHDLYEKCLEETYLKLEDVFTTGIVSQKLNIKRVHVNEFLNRRIPFNPCNIRKAISVHMIKPNEQIDLWAKFLNNAKCK